MPARLDALAADVEALAAAQLRTEERLATLTAQMEHLAAAQEGSLIELHRLSDWQRGELGRREGERYEGDTIRHAYAIFGGGREATERREDLDRIRAALAPLVAA